MANARERQQNSRDDLVKIVRELMSGKGSRKRVAEWEAILNRHFTHPNWTELRYRSHLSVEFRSPEEIVDLALSYIPPRIEHSLYAKLIEVAQTYRDRFAPGGDHRFVFDPVGLMFPDVVRKGGYWCDPENSVEFATTGGDGHHFCFLLKENVVSDDSPVLLCCPDDYPAPHIIVGENLYDFLCFGMHCAYFDVLGVLEYPDEMPEGWYGDETWEEQRQILGHLREAFGLRPWVNRKARFQELQDRYLHLFKMPPVE